MRIPGEYQANRPTGKYRSSRQEMIMLMSLVLFLKVINNTVYVASLRQIIMIRVLLRLRCC